MYNSRCAQLYREKLHQMAAQAMRLHGTKLHIDTGAESREDGVEETKESDFFAAHEQFPSSQVQDEEIMKPVTEPINKNGTGNGIAAAVDDEAAPDVSVALAGETKAAPRKSTIGGRKPAAKKPGGLGGKKGLGATKVTKNFSEIERDAEMADSIAGARRG